jgi:hypothetical protein
MTEQLRPGGPFLPPRIPTGEGLLLTDTTTQRRPINTRGVYKSMSDFYQSVTLVDDPIVRDSQYNERFSELMVPYMHLRTGERINRNTFWLEPAAAWPQNFPSTDTTSIVGQLDNQTVILKTSTIPSDLILLEELIKSGERSLGHVRDTGSGKEKAIRPGFVHIDDTEAELHAIQTLARYGYPVPQNATAHQFFYPWLDTITYDWIPGKDIASVLKEHIANGNHTEALALAKLFGQHLKQVWEPLLEGPLPDGSLYALPDNTIWNFIYTGSASPREAFVRIDVGELSTGTSPIGSTKYMEKIMQDLASDDAISDYRGSLMDEIRQGFGTSEK